MTEETTVKRDPIVAQEDKVPSFQKFIYGVAGPIDILSVWVLVSIAYNVFQMELKMTFNQVALILMSLRLWDAVADPVMGWISDNTRTRWGRRRPYILIGGILSGLTYPIIWWFPRDLSHVQIMAWVIGFGILFYTCFTIWAMPYQSLLMEMTPDYNERTRVASIRSIFQTVFSLINGFCWFLSMLPIFYVNGHASPINGMRYISIGIALLILVLGPLPAFFVKERYYEHDLTRKQPKIDLFKSLGETLTCKPFLILCVFTVFFLLGTSVFDGYGRYVGTYYVLNGDWGIASKFVGFGTIIYTVASLIMIQVFRWLSERIGKNKCMFISMGLVLISAAITWWTNNPAHPLWMLFNSFLIGAGYAGLWLMIPSMQADVVDYDELHTGERREGSFASVFSWVLKLSFCVGFMAAGPLLTITKFDAGEFDANRNVETSLAKIEAVSKTIAGDEGLAKQSEVLKKAAASLAKEMRSDPRAAFATLATVDKVRLALEKAAPKQPVEQKKVSAPDGEKLDAWELTVVEIKNLFVMPGLGGEQKVSKKEAPGVLMSVTEGLKTSIVPDYAQITAMKQAVKTLKARANASSSAAATTLDSSLETLGTAFPADGKTSAAALAAVVAALPKLAESAAGDKDSESALETLRKSSGELVAVLKKDGVQFKAAPPKSKVETTLTNMRIGYIALPLAASILALLVFYFFPLTQEKMAEIRKQLEERRGKV